MAVAPPHAFVFGVPAAIEWNLPLPLRILRQKADASGPRPVDVGVVAPHRASRARGVRGRQFDPGSVTLREHNGLIVTSPATTWVHLAGELGVDELIEVGDAIVHVPRKRGMIRGSPTAALGTVDQLRAAMSACRRRGIARMQEAWPQIRVGSASPPETRLRLACLRGGLPEPELDVDVYGMDGRTIGYTELAFPAYRVLVEYEGDHHRIDRTQWNRDIDKHAACAAAGWTVVRITSAHMHPTPDDAVRRIRDALRRNDWHG
jgi:hypothetical protein